MKAAERKERGRNDDDGCAIQNAREVGYVPLAHVFKAADEESTI